MEEIEALEGDTAAKEINDHSFYNIYKEGYRTNKVIEEEKQLQFGFDTGFCEGMEVGMALGRLSADLLTQIADKDESDSKAKTINKFFTEEINEIILKKDWIQLQDKLTALALNLHIDPNLVILDPTIICI